MNKPLSVARMEFAECMSKLIAESGLPAFMLYDILRDATNRLAQMADEQYKREKEIYENAQKEEPAPEEES